MAEPDMIAKVKMGEVAVAILCGPDGKRRRIEPRPPGFLGWLKAKLRGEQ